MSILQAVITAPLMSGGGPPTYTLTPAANNVDEGASLTFDVGGTNVPGGTYYWTIETNAGDFATTNGTVEIPTNYPVTGSNLVSFTVTPTADATTEATAETFTVALREVSITGTILVTSVAVTINDTSFAIGGSLMIGGDTRYWATTNATATTYGAYTYPDETSGSLHTLTGTQYVLSEGWGATSDISFNLWFYPTANDKLIIGELGQSSEDSGYHYSVLEINSTNRLKGRVWEMSTFQAVTSTGTVNLNAWNHVYMYFNNTTSTLSMSLNNETAVTQGSVGRNIPALSYWGIGLTDTQNMGSGARYQGKFDGLVIDSNIAQGSTYTATKAKYLPPAISDISASLTVAYDASYDSGSYGYLIPDPPFNAGFGTLASQTPSGIIGSIFYSPTSNRTTVTFKTGTYTGGNGSLVVTTPWRINGQDGNYSVTIGGVTQTMSQGAGGYMGLAITGDLFNLQAQNGQTLSVTINLT